MPSKAELLLAEVGLYLSNLNSKDDQLRNSKFMKVYGEKLSDKIHDYLIYGKKLEKIV